MQILSSCRHKQVKKNKALPEFVIYDWVFIYFNIGHVVILIYV